MAEHYDFAAVKAAVSCADYLEDQGIRVRGGRFNAVWRGGNRNSCSIHGNGWKDFANDDGGSVLDLAMRVEGFPSTSAAADELGKRYGVTPDGDAAIRPERVQRREEPKQDEHRQQPRGNRGAYLVRDGFTMTAKYDYTDEEGAVLYSVERFERLLDGKREKEFVQHVPGGNGLGDVRRVLYNLPAVLEAKSVYIVEGEKDVETMRGLGLVATTNSGGGKQWSEDFNKVFAGKDVTVIADNDEVGIEHGNKVYHGVEPFARSVRIAVVSDLPKGDVTDFMMKEGGTYSTLLEKIASYPQPEKPDPVAEKAREANKTAFSNFIEHRVGNKSIAEPVQITDLYNGCMTRFKGYPRMLGSTLFDFSKDGEIVELPTCDGLFAWISRVSGHNVTWRGGEGMISRKEFFECVVQKARRYSGIYGAPHYPARDDAFYTYASLPAPSAGHSAFWGMVKWFSPADEQSSLLMAAFFASPMWFEKGQSRPLWIIDTDDAQGSGKSTVAYMCAHLYGETAFELDFDTLDKDQSAVKKRLISSEGRRKRLALFDNVDSTLKSSVLSSLVTSEAITERAAYGRGEESRPNDLTFVATINGASSDSDMATRSYTLKVKKPEVMRPSWKKDVQTYIDTHRQQIYADLLDMMANAPARERRNSRFGEFDKHVLSAVCSTDEEFRAVDEYLGNETEGTNEDIDRANEFVELLDNALHNPGPNGQPSGICFDKPIIIRMTDVDEILRRSSGALRNWTSKKIRQLIKAGVIKECSKTFKQLGPSHEGFRQRAIFYGMSRQSTCYGIKTEFQFVKFDGCYPKVVREGLIDRVQ